MDTAGLVARIHADPRLLRLPLVRYDDNVTVGRDEATWTTWLARPT
jgi:arsenate reductase-like glutaredoxin family protein